MSRNHVSLVKDPVHGSIDLTLFEKRILGHHLVDRMQNIKQLSLVYRVFPGATHTRLIHSIGTMHVAWRIFKYAVANADAEVRKAYLQSLGHRIALFLTGEKNSEQLEELVGLWVRHTIKIDSDQNPQDIERIINRYKNDLLNNLKNFARLLHNTQNKQNKSLLFDYCKVFINDIIGPYFNINNFSCSGGYNDTSTRRAALEELVFALVAQALRIKALLHDVGHLPYSHILEFALSREMPESNPSQPSALHERISRGVELSLLFDTMVDMQNRKIEEEKNIINDIIAITIISIVNNFSEKYMFSEIYKSIISAEGSVDADRIDYVLRDGLCTGMLQSSGDYERVYKTFIVVGADKKEFESKIKVWPDINNINQQLPSYDDGNKVYLILPTVHGLNDVSQILVDRYRLAKNVNNHHRVRRLDGLLQEIVEIILNIDVEKIDENFEKNKNIDNEIQIIKNISKDFSHKKKEIEQLAKTLDVNGFYRRLTLSLALSLEFSEFTDDWVISRFRELHTALKQLNTKLTNHPLMHPHHAIGKLLVYLEELFSRRSFVSLWKRETDLFNIISIIPHDKGDLKNSYCQLWVIFRYLVNEMPTAWRKLSEKVEARLLDESSEIKAVFLARNTAKPSVSESKPLFLTELAVGEKLLLYRGELLQPSLRGISQSTLLDMPFFAYVLPKSDSTQLDKKHLAKLVLDETLSFYKKYLNEANTNVKKILMGEVDKCYKNLTGDFNKSPLG